MKVSIFKRQSLFFFYSLLQCILVLFFSIPSSDAAESVTLQLKWKHQFQFAGYYAAIEKGYYTEEDLDVTLIEGKPGGSEIEDVISGRANFGVGMSDILLARLKGKPIVVLANIFQHSPAMLLAIRSSGISTPQDLFGRKVMLGTGFRSAELRAMFINEGLSLDQIQIIKPSWNLTDLTDGKVDGIAAYISDQPYFLNLKNIPYTIISPLTYGIDFYGDNLFTSEREIKQHPKRVAAFTRASLKGWKYALDHPEEITDLILSKYPDGKRNITREFLLYEANSYQKLIFRKFVDVGHMNPGRWKHIADTYVKLGMADKDYSLDGFLYNPIQTRFNWGHWSIKLSLAFVCSGLAIIFFLLFFHRKLNREIHERKKSENALMKSETFLHSTGQIAKVGGWEIDGETQTVFWTKEIYNITEVPDDYDPSSLKKEAVVFFSAEDQLILEKVIQRAFEHNEPYDMEFLITTAKGNKKWMHAICEPIVVDGKVVKLSGIFQDITERKQAEKKLKKYQEIVSTMNDGFVIINPQGTLLEINDYFTRLTGWAREDLIGTKPPFKFWRRKDVPKIMETLSDLQDNDQTINGFDQILQKKDGGEVRCLVNSTILYDKDNKQRAFFGIFRDITDIKQAEESLRKKSHDLGERVKELNCLYEISNLIEKSDISLEKIFEGIVHLIPPAWQYPEIACVRLVLDNKEYKTKNFKETIWKRSEIIFIKARQIGTLEVCYLEERPESDEGPFLKEERNLINIITERLGTVIEQKRTEERLMIVNRFLEITNQQTDMDPMLKEFVMVTKDVTRCAAIGIRILDKDGNIPYTAYKGFSQKFYESENPLSIKSDQCMCINAIKGETDPELPFYTEYGSFYMNGTTHFLATVSEKEKGETRNACNREGYESVALVPIRLGGSILGLIHMADYQENMVPLETVELIESAAMHLGTAIQRIRDMTETRLLQDQLIRSERLAATGQLAASIAHEINSPLQGITSLLSLIKRNSKQDEALFENVIIVEDGFTSIRNIVKKMLDLNRPGKEIKQPINVNAVIEDTETLLKSHLKKNKIKMNLSLSLNVPIITASPQQLGQVLMNLINNSIDAMTGASHVKNDRRIKESADKEITISSNLNKNDIVIEVRDTGPGISKKDMEHIFDPFYTQKKKMGMGIGLSLCNGIIEDHNGTIVVDNVPGGGAIFTITLPLDKPLNDKGSKI